MKIIAPLAYGGKPDCQDVRCRRVPGEPGCMGWHCSYCDEPCSSQGHGCDAALTLIAAASDSPHSHEPERSAE
jgi:hypothetical protein